MELGKAIKALRKKKDLNQGEFSKRIGITQSYLSGIEKGRKKPSIEVVESIAKAIGVPLAVLFWFTLEEKDVHPDKLEAYNMIKPSVDKLVFSIFGNDKEY